DTAAGAIGGALGSGMYGAGEGLMKGENPLKSAAKQAQSGFLSGGLLGSAIAKGENLARKVNTEGINQMRQYWGIPWQKASGDPQKAINTLMENQRGFVPNVYNKPGVGKFDIPWGTSNYGLAHALERRAPQEKFNVTEFVNSIPKTIENGLVTKGSKSHPNTFNIETQKQKLAFAENFLGVKRNWMVTAFPQTKSAKKLLEDSKPFQNIASGNGTRSIPELLANNSINDYLLKHNPSQRLAPQIATFNTAVNSKMDDLLIPNELKPFLEKHEAQNKSARKRLGDLTPSENISSRNGGVSPSIPELLANNSINDYLLKHNPSQRLAPQIATFNTALNSKMNDLLIPDELKSFLEKHETKNSQVAPGCRTLGSNYSGKQKLPLPDLGVENSINDYLLKHNPSQRLASQIATFNTAVNSKMNDLLIPNELKPFLEKHEAQNKSAKKHFGDLTPSKNSSSGNGSFSAPSIPELLATDS
ncbi:MAG: hypothetical protein K2F57_01055, partial [Candidatus Gastranaerophilales bacterium]|nr:hypothetical protein [Candidatus Gastranaerophilales bacterium]